MDPIVSLTMALVVVTAFIAYASIQQARYIKKTFQQGMPRIEIDTEDIRKLEYVAQIGSEGKAILKPGRMVRVFLLNNTKADAYIKSILVVVCKYEQQL